MRKYPFITLTAALLFFLVVPFILKLKDPRLEIFPAVIFPSGAGKIEIEKDFFQPSYLELYAYHNDAFVRMDKKKFLGGIPIHYFFTIENSNFGLEEYVEEFKLYKPPVNFRIKNTFTPSSVAETKTWLKKQLREQGMKDSVFMVRHYHIKYNVQTGAVEKKDLYYEKIYHLD